MKMEVLAVQQQYQTQYGGLGSNKVRDWTSTLTPPPTMAAAKSNTTTTTAAATKVAVAATTAAAIPSPPSSAVKSAAAVAAATAAATNTAATPYHHHHLYHHHHHHHRQMAATNKMKNSINKKTTRAPAAAAVAATTIDTNAAAAGKLRGSATTTATAAPPPTTTTTANIFYCDNNNIDAAAVNELSLRLLDELRAAKSRHLTCTEVSLPCDLTPSIAAEIIRVSEKEPCGIRGCTIYIEFEDEPNNSRRIASLKLDPETVSTFEVYLTLRQDHRGWTALLPQFMKSLARTITISPEFTITKHKLYSPQQRSSYSMNIIGGNSNSSSSNFISSSNNAAAAGTASATAPISTPSS